MKPPVGMLPSLAGGCFALAILSAQVPSDPVPAFGVTVVAPFGFCGRIYELPERREMPDRRPDAQPPFPGRGQPADSDAAIPVDCSVKLPEFQRLEPIGKIYTTRLNVTTRDFREGFPGVTNRFEWFAINYSARIWIETPGKYSFVLLSDDGARCTSMNDESSTTTVCTRRRA